MNTPPRLFLLDAMALIYRAYYALNKSPRINSQGLNTSAVLGFTNTLYELLRSEKPSHIGVAFDTIAPTARHIDFVDYKANRPPMPEDIAKALPWIREVIKAFQIPILEADGYEADDVIGTLAKKSEKAGFNTFMVTPDKDFGQLVSPTTFIYKPSRMGQGAEILGVNQVCEKFGIQRPEQIIDMLGLMGDSADNFPGVPGVGPVAARKLLEQFDSIDQLLANTDKIANEKLREKIETHRESAIMSKQLATICLDAPVPWDPDSLLYHGPNANALREVLDQLEFRSFAKRVFTDLSITPELKKLPAATSKVLDLFSMDYDLFSETPPVIRLADQPQAIPQFETLLNENTECAIYIPLNANKAFLCWDQKDIFELALNLNSQPLQLWTAWIKNPKHHLIGFGLKQILHALDTANISLHCKLFDLNLAAYVCQPERPQSIDSHLRQIFQVELAHAIETSVRYFSPWRDHLLVELEQLNQKTLFEQIETPLINILFEMEREGVKLDLDRLKILSEEMSRALVDLENDIYFQAGHHFNIASPKQLGEVLFDELQIVEKTKKTKTKQYSTAEEVLSKIADRHPIVALVLKYRTLSKLKSTYIDALPALIQSKSGRLHTEYVQTMTATGRLSSRNPNLQNIPIRTEIGREIRKAFIPRNNEFLWMAADYSQIELRILASMSGDTNMMDDFIQGHDIHSATAAKIHQVPIQNVTADQRRSAKSVNFGIVYGISAFGLSEQLGISRTEAQAIIERYFEQYPKIRQFIQDCIESARDKGYAETLCGRRRYLPDINSSNGNIRAFAERNAVNAPIQGSSADMIKKAMLIIHQRMKEENLQSKMILQVHDELVFDAWIPEIEPLKIIVTQAMENALTLNLPLKIDINVGHNWLEAH